MPFLDLVSLDFLFPSFAKVKCVLRLQKSALPAVRHYRKAAPMCAPSRCVGLARAVLWSGPARVLGTNPRQENG